MIWNRYVCLKCMLNIEQGLVDDGERFDDGWFIGWKGLEKLSSNIRFSEGRRIIEWDVNLLEDLPEFDLTLQLGWANNNQIGSLDFLHLYQ